MQVEELVRQAQDAITVKRVFAEPIEVDGVTVIPAARLGGGAGGGGGQDDSGDSGEGGGFGVGARPAGVYVVRSGDVTWRPAVDVNGIVSTVGAVAIVWLLTRARVRRARIRHAKHA